MLTVSSKVKTEINFPSSRGLPELLTISRLTEEASMKIAGNLTR